MSAKTIVITGPESSGKTVLAQQLANYYDDYYLAEYAREYLALKGVNYTEEDVLNIAKGQFRRQEEALAKADKYLFCDTGLLVTKVWSEYKYKSVDPWIEEAFATDNVDLYVLCNCDIPWEYDPLRENPFDRPELFDVYRNHLQAAGKNFIAVSGRHTSRLNEAINSIEAL